MSAQQIEQLVYKYSNLKLKTNISPNQTLSLSTLKSLDDSLSKFSELLKGISVSEAVSMMKTKSLANHSNMAQTYAVALSNDYGEPNNQYQWSSFKNVGSSQLGYFQVYYSAQISYQTNNSTGTFLNYITLLAGLNSSSPNSLLTDGRGNYYSFNYTAGSNTCLISSDKSNVQLNFAGKGNFSHTYYVSNAGGVSTPLRRQHQTIQYQTV